METEIAIARAAALKTARAHLDVDDSAVAQRLKLEYHAALSSLREGSDPGNSPENLLRQDLLPSSRRALEDLRSSGLSATKHTV